MDAIRHSDPGWRRLWDGARSAAGDRELEANWATSRDVLLQGHPPTQLSTIDTAQLSEVLKFKSSLQSEGLTHSFLGTGNFESHLRVHLHSVIAQLRPSAVAVRPTSNLLPMEPYKDFHTKFREVIAAQRLPEVGAVLHVVLAASLTFARSPPVIPVGQAFDFRQRGPRSVLASFESISVEGRRFFGAPLRLGGH